MKPGRLLRQARRRAGMTQKELATRAGVPQSTVARIETGVIDPRASTLDRLLRACDHELDVVARLGRGIDRTLIDEDLKRSPAERLEQAAAGAEFLAVLGRARRIRA